MFNFLFKAVQYLKFLIKSTNKHGVHSPFVFDLVTKCFNNKAFNVTSSVSKSSRLSDKIIQYLKDTDTIVVEYPISDVNEIHQQIRNLQNDSCILILNPYRSKENFKKWNQLIKLKTVTVSIDTFYVGLLFARSEQLKQHFVIRA